MATLLIPDHPETKAKRFLQNFKLQLQNILAYLAHMGYPAFILITKFNFAIFEVHLFHESIDGSAL